MKKPELSVIMSIYKENTTQLKKSFNSILNQTYKNFEFIVILDNPKNIEAKNFVEKLSINDKRIKFFKNDRNRNLAYSLNKAIKESNGKYLVRMDSNDECNKNRFKLQYNYLKKNKNVDLLFTQWIEIDESGSKIIRKPKKEWFKNIEENFFIKSMLLHASLMCKTEILKKHKYPIMTRPEDFALFLKLIKKKYKFDLLEKILYIYYVDNLNWKNKYKKIKIYSSNFIKILLINFKYFWNNKYYWIMFIRVLSEFILSRNKFFFKIFYINLSKIYKKFII